jgi:hypothetical protein
MFNHSSIDEIKNARKNKKNIKEECSKYKDIKECNSLPYCMYSQGYLWNSCEPFEIIQSMKEGFCKDLNNKLYKDELIQLAIAIGFKENLINELDKSEICELLSNTDLSVLSISKKAYQKIGISKENYVKLINNVIQYKKEKSSGKKINISDEIEKDLKKVKTKWSVKLLALGALLVLAASASIPVFIKPANVQQTSAADRIAQWNCDQNNICYRKDIVGVENKIDDFCQSGNNMCKGNLEIPRAAMPQIDNNLIDKFLVFLEEIDDKISACPRSGVYCKPSKTPVDMLIPTQNEIRTSKSNSIALSILRGEMKMEDSPIIISEDNYILDGHHRWAAMKLLSYFKTLPSNELYDKLWNILKDAKNDSKTGNFFKGFDLNEKNVNNLIKKLNELPKLKMDTIRVKYPIEDLYYKSFLFDKVQREGF